MTIVFPNQQDSLAKLASEARRLADALDRLAAEGQPTAADMIDAPVLTDWWIGTNPTPALRGSMLCVLLKSRVPAPVNWTTRPG